MCGSELLEKMCRRLMGFIDIPAVSTIHNKEKNAASESVLKRFAPSRVLLVEVIASTQLQACCDRSWVRAPLRYCLFCGKVFLNLSKAAKHSG